jgi:hypothetical protein
VKELISQVANRAHIPETQATLAVAAVLEYLTARLPSPVVGRIYEQLDLNTPPSSAASSKITA